MSVNATDALQIARRYTTAIFSLASEAKKEEIVTQELSVLAAAIEGSAELLTALSSPVIGNDQKVAVLKALVSKADPLTQRAVDVIAQGGRGDVIPAIAQDLRARLAEHQGTAEALVTSAHALPAGTQKQLEQALIKATGKKVQLKLKEDPAVLGGLKIELGSLQLDATLAGALNNMREQLLATTH